jgi:hypothetical protein
MSEQRATALLAAVRRYHEAHPQQDAFATEDIVDWVVAQQLLTADTAMARALLAEEINEALASARRQRPDGQSVPEYWRLPTDDAQDLDDEFKALTERPLEGLTLPEAKARLRRDLQRTIETTTQFLTFAADFAQQFPDEPPHPGIPEAKKNLTWARKQLAALDAPREPPAASGP